MNEPRTMPSTSTSTRACSIPWVADWIEANPPVPDPRHLHLRPRRHHAVPGDEGAGERARRGRRGHPGARSTRSRASRPACSSTSTAAASASAACRSWTTSPANSRTPARRGRHLGGVPARAGGSVPRRPRRLRDRHPLGARQHGSLRRRSDEGDGRRRERRRELRRARCRCGCAAPSTPRWPGRYSSIPASTTASSRRSHARTSAGSG